MNLTNMTAKQLEDLAKRVAAEVAARESRAAADAALSTMRTCAVELAGVIALVEKRPILVHSISQVKLNDFKVMLKQILEDSRLDKSN